MTRARSLSQLANSNVFSVDANNSRVGIGSTIPDVKLDVGGDLYADNLTINNLIGVAATFSGVVTYEDVTNVDSIGIITARSYVSIADSIVHTGDTDTSIRFPAADTFTVETAGSERLRITSDGMTEIFGGTATSGPGGVLQLSSKDQTISAADEVFGSITFKSNDASTGQTGVFAKIDAASNRLFDGDNASGMNLRFYAGDKGDGVDTPPERLRISSSGNIGINTTIPESLLEIMGDSTAGDATITFNRAPTTSNDGVIGQLFFQNNTDSVALISAKRESAADDAYIQFATQATGGGLTERARINSSGDLIVDAGGDAQDIQIKSHSANSGHGIIYMRGNASGERSSIQLNHFGYADWLISAGGTGNGEFSITNTDQGTDGIKLSSDGDLLPAADNSLDLGSTSLRWANIYSADLQLSNEGSVNDVDGTWGQYTIQEGENDLFLLNRRNGKTYKFVLQEVD
jgi:hypothetical protein